MLEIADPAHNNLKTRACLTGGEVPQVAFLDSAPALPVKRVFLWEWYMQVYMLNWRLVVIRSDLPSNAKYLAIYLSTWMNEWGDNCYPSIKRISHETGLSEPTVVKYIQVLRTNGWLEAKKKGFDGQAWAHNQYYPNIPQKVLKEINRLDEGTKTERERHLNSHEKALKEVNTIFTDNSTENSTDYMSSPSVKNQVPFQKIINLYHEMLPQLPKVEKLTTTRKGYIRQRFIEDLPSLENWENYFDYVAQSDFLMGRSQPSNGRPPFRASLEWLTKPANYAKVAEENYHGV